MKNKEKFKDEIVEIACNNSNVAVDNETNKPVKCHRLYCGNCLFYGEITGLENIWFKEIKK